jgi:hypothetical protein
MTATEKSELIFPLYKKKRKKFARVRKVANATISSAMYVRFRLRLSVRSHVKYDVSDLSVLYENGENIDI